MKISVTLMIHVHPILWYVIKLKFSLYFKIYIYLVNINNNNYSKIAHWIFKLVYLATQIYNLSYSSAVDIFINYYLGSIFIIY